MGQREIVGPQERFERSGAQRLRDIRPITTRMWSAMMSEFSSVLSRFSSMRLRPRHRVIFPRTTARSIS